jgi:beta-lactamase regulating signal transducer with metallopeptidase domain
VSAAWLVYALVTGTLIALSAAALDGVARSRRWPTRWVWAASMVASLVVIAGSTRRTADPIPVGVLERSAAAVGSSGPAGGSMLVRILTDLRGVAESAMVAGVSTAARWLPAWIGTFAAALWMLGAAAALTVFALVHLRLRRARRTWPMADLHGHRVRVAPTVGPAVLGLVRPEIVVPQWLLDRAAEEQRLVLAHEEEHVRAHDHLLLGGACVVVALMPWHPAAWWSLARLRLALELDCDARVLRRGAPARSYGEMLIDLAGQCSGFRVGATALADKTSHLERRLLAMKPTTQRFTPLRLTVLCAAAALSLAAACEARVPTSAEIQSMDVAGAERAAGSVGLVEALHGGRAPEFYVNGVKVSAAEAHAIPASDIATVNVEKGPGNASSIRIVTAATTANGMRYRGAVSGSDSGALRIAGRPASIEADKVSFGPAGVHERVAVSDGAFSGLVFINGKRADAAALHKLDPNTIAGVEIIKGAAAERISSDPAAKNGIIKVTLK